MLHDSFFEAWILADIRGRIKLNLTVSQLPRLATSTWCPVPWPQEQRYLKALLRTRAERSIDAL